MDTSRRSPARASRCCGLRLVQVLLATAVAGGLAGNALAGPDDHMYVIDGSWQNNNVLEYDLDGNLVRSFNDTLPAGYRLDMLEQLRRGPDFHLYSYGRVNTGSGDWKDGAVEWTVAGQFVAFHERSPAGNSTGGFELSSTGDFYTVDGGDGAGSVKEWDRAFTSSTTFAFSGSGSWGDQSAKLYGNDLFVVGASCLAKYDITTRQWITSYSTSRDNDALAISESGLIAVNDQWTGGDVGITDKALIEIYNPDGTLAASVFMPEAHWTTRGMSFDSSGNLYVACNYDPTLNDNGTPGDPGDDYFENWKAQIVVFDANFVYQGAIRPDWTIFAADVFVPEPATLALLALGGLGLLTRRRRSR